MELENTAEQDTRLHGSALRVEAITDDKITGWVDKDAESLVAHGLMVRIDDHRYATFHPEGMWQDGDTGARCRRFELALPKQAMRDAERSLVEVSLAATGEILPNGARYPVRTDRARRALVLIPAGSRYDHDKVRLHKWSMQKLMESYVNIGDLMVYDSTLKLLQFAAIEVASITKIEQKDIDRYNAEFDFAFLRGSNFIHPHMQWRGAGGLIEKLKIPVYAIGVGAQAAEPEKIVLPSAGVRVWSAIADHCGSIGVRGAYSAQVLADNGIKNVEVVGCPSVYRSRDRRLTLNLKEPFDIRKIAFSLRRETGAGYARDVKSYREIQREFMLRLDVESDMTVTIHGEQEEKAFYFRDVERMAEAAGKLREDNWFTPENEQQMLDIYRSRLFFNTSVEQFDDFIRTVDLAVGYRVHAVLPALANGVPGIMVGYDMRTTELAEAHAIPILKEEEIAGRSWRDLYRPELFTGFQKSYPQGYRRMKQFLERNGVPNRM